MRRADPRLDERRREAVIEQIDPAAHAARIREQAGNVHRPGDEPRGACEMVGPEALRPAERIGSQIDIVHIGPLERGTLRIDEIVDDRHERGRVRAKTVRRVTAWRVDRSGERQRLRGIPRECAAQRITHAIRALERRRGVDSVRR